MPNCEYCGKPIREEEKEKISSKRDKRFCSGDTFCEEFNTRWFLATIVMDNRTEKYLCREISLKNRGMVDMKLEDGNLSFSVAYFDQITIETKKIPEALILIKHENIISTNWSYMQHQNSRKQTEVI